MIRNFAALVAGLAFGAGLLLSGMYEPAKVFGFLDLAGAWDPSLAFVMGGAIGVAFPAFLVARRLGRDLQSERIELPATRPIDAPLIVGALVFGAGWGLSGVCPGPGVMNLGFLSFDAVLFVAAMGVGMAAHWALTSFRLRGLRPLMQDA